MAENGRKTDIVPEIWQKAGCYWQKMFDVVNTVFMILLMIVMIYPFLNVLAVSLSSPSAINAGVVTFIPRGVNLSGYKYIIEDGRIFTGYRNMILYASAGTLLTLTLTSLAAYALTRRQLVGRKFFNIYWAMLSQSLLGIRQEADEMLNHSYLCAGIAAETEEERQAAIAAILEKTNGKLLCVISGFSILYLPFDSLDADGISALSQGIRGRVAVGISRIHTSISEAPLAYQETADVFRKPCGELPVLYSAGRDGIEDVIGLPLEAREAEALLGDILRGNSEAALAFVNRLLDKTAPRSIDRKRYVTGFLLNLFELAHNGIKQKAYDSQEVMDELGGTLDYEVMCAVIRDCCEKLTRSYASSDDDVKHLTAAKPVKHKTRQQRFIDAFMEAKMQ